MNKIKEALEFDALAEAERITGNSYKNDSNTSALGLLMHMESSQRKNRLMEETSDSKFSETEQDYLKIVESIGFKTVLLIPFKNKDGIEERMYIMWHDKYSILLKWDTFTYGDDGSWARSGEEVPPPSRNSGNFYYNYSPNEHWRMVSGGSGGFVFHDKNSDLSGYYNNDFSPHEFPSKILNSQPKWNNDDWESFHKEDKAWHKIVSAYADDNKLRTIRSGYHDCREAIKYHINQLSENGTFLHTWKEQPFLWLLHHGDTDGDYDYETINAERIAMLPKEIQKRIKA